MPAPFLDPSALGGEAGYIAGWIKDELGYECLIDPALGGVSVDVNHDTHEIRVRPCDPVWFHSRAGRAAMRIIGKMRGELWFPESFEAPKPHLRLINGGAS